MTFKIAKRIAAAAATLATGALLAAPAQANNALVGVWLDHTGRGAVEIAECGARLCGKIVWVKDATGHKDACGLQVIGNVKQSGPKWNGGWIYDPEEDEKYDVELTLQGPDKLKVVGYAGLMLFSETLIWTKAPADLKRCKA